VVALLALLPLLAPSHASAQQGCTFGEGSRNFEYITIADGSRIVYVGGPHLICSDGVEIWADTAVAYQGSNFSHLMGHVRFEDPKKTLTADTARYFTRQGRLQAHGHVEVHDRETGADIRGENLIYLLQTDFREEETMDVSGGRPEALLFILPAAEERVDTLADTSVAAPPDTSAAAPPDTSAAAAPPDTVATSADSLAAPPDTAAAPPDTVRTPYHVVADRLFLQADRYFRATGDVEIERDSLTALADTAVYDQLAGRIFLRLDARVESATYQIMAPRIDLALAGDDIREVRARDDAVLLGEELRLDAPLIRIFLKDGSMDRLVAVPQAEQGRKEEGRPGAERMPTPADAAVTAGEPSRPVAVAQDFTLEADSIEVAAPGEVLDRIVAVGRARGESSARDSLNTASLPEVARKDWLEGDTIVATFVPAPPAADSAAPADSSRAEYILKRLVARGKARSLYRLPPSDTTAKAGVDLPAVHYVLGSRITIVLTEGQVDRMEVEGPTQGLHLEPLPAHSPDSTAIRPDTAALPDTASLPDTTAGGAAPVAAASRARARAPGRRQAAVGSRRLDGMVEPRSARILTDRPPRRAPRAAVHTTSTRRAP